MDTSFTHIIGAGPAGLSAAITLAKAGHHVTVYEKNRNVGERFNGDYQGIENWTTDDDALSFLANIGIEINFRCEPYRKGDFFNPIGTKYNFNMARPLFYLVERGTSDWSLDQGLRKQAERAGVLFKWGEKLTQSPETGNVIIATGPSGADAIAKGIVFSTSHEDYYSAFVSNDIAPQGYAYLLVNQGKATFATCLFEHFSKSHMYFDKALEEMKKQVPIEITDPRNFGGYVNFSLNQQLVKHNRVYYVGERAGFQDALFGFGMRYALLSGYLAAKSIIEKTSYPKLCEEQIIPQMKTSLSNRWLFSRLNNSGYSVMLNRLKPSPDIISELSKQYNLNWFKRALLPVAKHTFKTRLNNKQCMHENCSCIWCKHGNSMHSEVEC